jgi:hypothetical protein
MAIALEVTICAVGLICVRFTKVAAGCTCSKRHQGLMTPQLFSRDFILPAMSDYGVLPSRAQVPHVPLTCTQCSTPIEYLSPNPLPAPGTALRIRCYKCSAIITHQVGPAQTQAGMFSIIIVSQETN